MYIICSILIGLLIGETVYRISNKIVDEEKEKLKSFELNKVLLMIAAVIITAAIILKFNLGNSIRYLVLTTIIGVVAIIDYYTHLVYLEIVIPGAIIAIGTNVLMMNNGSFIVQGLICGFILTIAAHYSGKWFGDVQLIFIITVLVGIRAILFIIGIAFLGGILIGIYKRNLKLEVAFCPLLGIGYLMYLIIL